MKTYHHLLRERGGEEAAVGYAELLFDLIYVFAVTQLSHFLLHHLSWNGFARTCTLWFAVWMIWQHTAWVTNWFDPDKRPIRLMLFALMVVGLLMASALPEAFGERGLIFALCYTAMQMGRPLFVLALLGREHALSANYRRILGWAAISSAFWLVGAFQQGDARLLLWAAGVLCDYTAPMFGFYLPGLGRSNSKEDWNVDGGHMAERIQLFVIIAFGETILMSGVSLSETAVWDAEAVAGAVVSFTGTLAMWWIYFDSGSSAGSAKILHSADPGGLGLKYHAVHIVLVGALVVCAVGDELVVNHPQGSVDGAALLTLVAAPCVYIFANLLYKKLITGRVPRSHLLAGAALAALLPLAPLLTRLELNAAVTAVFFGIIVFDYLPSRKQKAPARPE